MINRTLFIYTIILSILITINVSPANAQIISAKVSVVGMACPFCAYGVEKKLKKVEGVESITIDMKEGTATLSAIEGKSINIAQIPEAIRESGFTPGKLKITAIGTIIKDERKRLYLQISEMGRGLPIIDVKKSVKERLVSQAQSGGLVKIRGVIHEDSGGVLTLSPDSAEEVFK